MIAALIFYAFAAVLIASAVMVVTARNPVHSVLFLILAFFNASGLFLLAGAEFLAMTLVIVYVGAVAVLFLFVVMMLDIDFAQLREGFQRYAPLGAVVGGILFLELVMVLASWRFAPEAATLRMNPTPSGMTNSQAIGHILYTDNIYLFQVCGLILLVAMIQYGLLALFAAILATPVGLVLAYMLNDVLLDVQFSFATGTLLVVIGGAIVFTAILGATTILAALQPRPALRLREMGAD